jgi:hypothetical protein
VLSDHAYTEKVLEWMSSITPSCSVLHLFGLAGSAGALDVWLAEKVGDVVVHGVFFSQLHVLTLISLYFVVCATGHSASTFDD